MEKTAFEIAVRKQQKAWLRLGMQFFGGAESDARDALQETLLRLWVVRERLDSEADAVALGTRIMKNECVNIHRQRQHLADNPPPDAPSMADNPHCRLEADEQRALLHWAVGHLSTQMRCLLQLHLYEDMSLEEIAAATGKSNGAVRTMITRAKQQITQWLRTQR